MLRILFYIFLIYLGYQFIQYFLIPVYRTTKQVKKTFSGINERMNDLKNEKQPPRPQQSSKNQDAEKAGEYIDFEEIK